eukprot:540024-Prymnesium_polylepis.2
MRDNPRVRAAAQQRQQLLHEQRVAKEIDLHDHLEAVRRSLDRVVSCAAAARVEAEHVDNSAPVEAAHVRAKLSDRCQRAQIERHGRDGHKRVGLRRKDGLHGAGGLVLQARARRDNHRQADALVTVPT